MAKENTYKSLGELHRLYQREDKGSTTSLPRVAQIVPDLTRYGAGNYEDLIERLKQDGFNAWCSIVRQELTSFNVPEFYWQELYCRSRALLFGMELLALGEIRFPDWKEAMLRKLDQNEQKIIEPYSDQIYELARNGSDKNSPVLTEANISNEKHNYIFRSLLGVLLALVVFIFVWFIGNAALMILDNARGNRNLLQDFAREVGMPALGAYVGLMSVEKFIKKYNKHIVFYLFSLLITAFIVLSLIIEVLVAKEVGISKYDLVTSVLSGITTIGAAYITYKMKLD